MKSHFFPRFWIFLLVKFSCKLFIILSAVLKQELRQSDPVIEVAFVSVKLIYKCICNEKYWCIIYIILSSLCFH